MPTARRRRPGRLEQVRESHELDDGHITVLNAAETALVWLKERTEVRAKNAWPEAIGAITLIVEDPAASRQFYGDVFGLPVVAEDDDSTAFRFRNPDESHAAAAIVSHRGERDPDRSAFEALRRDARAGSARPDGGAG